MRLEGLKGIAKDGLQSHYRNNTIEVVKGKRKERKEEEGDEVVDVSE